MRIQKRTDLKKGLKAILDKLGLDIVICNTDKYKGKPEDGLLEAVVIALLDKYQIKEMDKKGNGNERRIVEAMDQIHETEKDKFI